MEDNLVIVESPAKAKTIKKFLGDNFLVKSSYGHIRDLEKKNFGIDIDNNYQPRYIIPEDKKEVVKELKNLAKKAKVVWLATDEDREGEAIAWHLYQVLELSSEKTKRIVFHEITKEAIQKAIQNSRKIDVNLVNAQTARRILDRLVGFELSPVLWKKVKPSLSAGRVQSAAVRLIVEREREILNFKSVASYKVTGTFVSGEEQFRADLNKKLQKEDEAKAFLEKCHSAEFTVADVTKKPSKKHPSAPFTTSTLQQEASRKLGFSVARTMRVAQNLYEAGKITYMRTDSVNLSGSAINSASQVIEQSFGNKYLKTRKYQTKTKGAQEAHEAIRPTYIQNREIGGNEAEKKLYDLIWKRTVASQMSDAELEKTNIRIDISHDDRYFNVRGEVIKFDGFLKLYIESSDEENEKEETGIIPNLKKGDALSYKEIRAIQRFSNHPPRYTEASLVRKMEELGIGRPSTYAPTISTIQERGYVVKEDRPGTPRNYKELVLTDKVELTTNMENAGVEKKKLFPNDIGMVVNDFLNKHFPEIVNYNFTAEVEQDFDQIAQGYIEWSKMIDNFYKTFHEKVENTLEVAERSSGERILGKDPKTGRQVAVKIGPYGPMVQLGTRDEEEKPKFASLQKGQHIETINLEEALKLFQLPRTLGKFEDEDVIVSIGRFGPYVKHRGKYASLKKDVDDPFSIKLDRAIELIKEKRERDNKKIIQSFSDDKDLIILRGRFGPYISYKSNNYRVPKDKDPEKLSLNDCYEIIESKDKKGGKATKKKKTAKTTKSKTGKTISNKTSKKNNKRHK
ncbi:MAG: type I DNA topoisomerase [Bacteroidales bacterium]